MGMKMRLSGTIVLLVIAQGLAGCRDSGSPTAPPAPPPPPPIRLAVFTDSNSGFSTSDVRDVDDQIVRFNIASKPHELIWTAGETSFPEYPVYGNFIQAYRICSYCALEVRFGIKDGERRAYLTWGDDYNHYYSGNLVDVEVVNGTLVMTETKVRVPGT